MNLKFPMSEEEAQRYLAESAEALARKPIKSTHPLATIGSKTQRGGEVATATTGLEIIVEGNPLRVARVGDTVRYADGSESVITSGAGIAMCHRDQPVAVVGSHLANGDQIVESLQSRHKVVQYVDEPAIEGLLQPGYVPPSRTGVAA